MLALFAITFSQEFSYFRSIEILVILDWVL